MTQIGIWVDRSIGIVEPMANLYAYDARGLADAIRDARLITQLPTVIVTLESAVLVDRDVLDVIFRQDMELRERGGRIVLCCVSAPVGQLLAQTKVSDPLPVYSSLEDALRERTVA